MKRGGMMKKRSNRLKPVASHAKNQEQYAARVFAEAQQRVSDSENQLVQLVGFRDEYLGRYKSENQQLNSMSQILDYQAFLEKLNKGIGQAHNTISVCKQQCDILKQQWLQRRVKRQALDSVVVKYQQDENKHELHLEQLEMEEFNMQCFHNRRE